MSGRGRVQRESAGLLMYRQTGSELQVLLGHPGGPFWKTRDRGAWTIPKGGIHPGETPLETAIREFVEETGFQPCEPYLDLGHIVQRSGKIVHAWAFEGNCDPSRVQSVSTFVEWPPRSGKRIEIPELDRVEFFSILNARDAINVAQAEFLDRLVDAVSGADRR